MSDLETTHAPTLTDYVEQVENIDSTLYLGRVVWYFITEQTYIHHGTFCQELLTRIPSSPLPSTPRSSDVFKRACTAAQEKRVPTTDPNVFFNINIREVGKDAENIWRQVVIERIDTSGRTLDYHDCVEIHYDRRLELITERVLPGKEEYAEMPEVERTIKAVHDLYHTWYNQLTPYVIREFLRRFIRGQMHATILRDGVYFVSEDKVEQVKALEEVVATLGGGSLLHHLPLVDDRKQREYLRRAFEEESVGEIDRLLGEMRDIMTNDRKITSDRFADYKVEYDRLRRKVADYSDLLDEAMVATASRLEVMDKALFELMGHIRT